MNSVFKDVAGSAFYVPGPAQGIMGLRRPVERRGDVYILLTGEVRRASSR
jgi:hypothetical protein